MLPPRSCLTTDALVCRKHYLCVSVVVSVVFSVVLPVPSGLAGVVSVFVSTVVVAPVVLPSLVCVVVDWVLFSVESFLPSQPMVNTPSVAIITNAKKRFIFKPFQKMLASPLHQPERFRPRGSSKLVTNMQFSKNEKSRRGGTPSGIQPRRLTL